MPSELHAPGFYDFMNYLGLIVSKLLGTSIFSCFTIFVSHNRTFYSR